MSYFADTAATLGFLKALGGLTFSPMTEGDRHAFAGAGDDAQSAEGTDEFVEACALGRLEGGLFVIVNGSRVEAHGTAWGNGDPVTLTVDISSFTY